MKPLDQTCADCPSRQLMPDIGALTKHLIDNYPEIAKQIQADGMSPMFGAVVALRTISQQLDDANAEIEELKADRVEGVNCNESE